MAVDTAHTRRRAPLVDVMRGEGFGLLGESVADHSSSTHSFRQSWLYIESPTGSPSGQVSRVRRTRLGRANPGEPSPGHPLEPRAQPALATGRTVERPTEPDPLYPSRVQRASFYGAPPAAKGGVPGLLCHASPPKPPPAGVTLAGVARRWTPPQDDFDTNV